LTSARLQSQHLQKGEAAKESSKFTNRKELMEKNLQSGGGAGPFLLAKRALVVVENLFKGSDGWTGVILWPH
jgi:hypothetical protein